MSTINAQNYGDGTDSVPASAVIQGTAKAWVNFNGTGTVAIRESFNLGSITDNGTGDYTVNFSSALTDANYAFSGQSSQGSGQIAPRIAFYTEGTTRSANALQIKTEQSNITEAPRDNQYVELTVTR